MEGIGNAAGKVSHYQTHIYDLKQFSSAPVKPDYTPDNLTDKGPEARGDRELFAAQLQIKDIRQQMKHLSDTAHSEFASPTISQPAPGVIVDDTYQMPARLVEDPNSREFKSFEKTVTGNSYQENGTKKFFLDKEGREHYVMEKDAWNSGRIFSEEVIVDNKTGLVTILENSRDIS